MNKKESTNKIYEDLINKAFYPTLVFLPRNLEEFLNEIFDKDQYEPLLENLFCLESMTKSFTVNRNSNLNNILLKTIGIRQNLFDLIDQKKFLNKHKFNILINKYYNAIVAGTDIYNIMANGASKPKHKIPKKHLVIIKHQFDAMELHKEELEKNFKCIKKSSHVLILEESENSKDFSNHISKAENIGSKNSNQTNIKTLISNSEADDFLLTSIFNIDLNKSN